MEIFMSTINTKNIEELQTAFESVVAKYNLEAFDGIKNRQISLEDRLPWFTLYGNLEEPTAVEVVQDLANEMNIRVLLNRSEVRYQENGKDLTIYGVFDIDYKVLIKNGQKAILPAFSENPEIADFMNEYGKPFLPQT